MKKHNISVNTMLKEKQDDMLKKQQAKDQLLFD